MIVLTLGIFGISLNLGFF